MIVDRFIRRSEQKNLFITALISGIILFGLFVFSQWVVHRYLEYRIEKSTQTVRTVMAGEIGNLVAMRDALLPSAELSTILRQGDRDAAQSFAQSFKVRTSANILLTDRWGTVLARAGLPDEYGDNIFQTTAYGRVLATGTTVQAVVRGARFPLLMMAAAPVYDGGVLVGSVALSRVVDEPFVERIWQDHFNDTIHLAFYSHDAIIGSTLTNDVHSQLVRTYFDPASGKLWNRDTFTTREFRISDRDFFVKNSVFLGTEDSPGGFLVFARSFHYTFHIIVILLTVIAFLVIESYLHYRYRYIYANRHRLLLGSVLIFLSASGFLLFRLHVRNEVIELPRLQHLIYNSTLSLNPDADIVAIGTPKSIALTLQTGGEPINAVQAVVRFDPSRTSVVAIKTERSFCDDHMFIERSIDAQAGVVRLACIVPNPGFFKAQGVIADLVLVPHREGDIVLTFEPDTRVLANDGLGTDVLRAATGVQYRVTKNVSPEAGGPPLVFSDTHPNNTAWYRRQYMRFSWLPIEGAVFDYALTREPEYDFSDARSTKDSSIVLEATDDGLHYFHLRMRKDNIVSAASVYRVMLDATPPTAPYVLVSSTRIKRGEVVRFDFHASDERSGLASGFYIKINDGIFLPVKAPLYIPFIVSGEYRVTLRVFDVAGNHADQTVLITVQ